VNKRAVLIAGAAMLVLAPISASTAYAGVGPGPVSCTGSCVIQLTNSVTFGGNYSRGTDNADVSVPPPPCQWIAIGNATTGSQEIINNLNQVDSIEGSLTAQELALLAKATKIAAEKPPPAGEWYGEIPTSYAANDVCSPNVVFVTPANGGAINPPAVPLPPRTLAALAVKVMVMPTAGRVLMSPSGGTTYSNMPTFVRVTMRGNYELSGGRPYLVVSAALDGQGATAWAYASRLSLTTTASDAQVWGSCGFLGSEMMVREPGVVARTGADGSADCGFTFRVPQKVVVAASVTWGTCWVPVAEAGTPPPPAGCTTGGVPAVPDAFLAPLDWNAGVNVEEIQAGNG
jgi:hypothetical protein